MSARYTANCKISRPIAIKAQPDVDLNGMMFSYTVGLMFPAQAATQMAQSYATTPPPQSVGAPLGQAGRT